jgi:hypothetical protein
MKFKEFVLDIRKLVQNSKNHHELYHICFDLFAD